MRTRTALSVRFKQTSYDHTTTPPSPVEPVEIAAWLGCLFFLVAGWNQVEGFFDRRTRRAGPREIHPQPLAITNVDPPAADSVCRGRHQALTAELARLEQDVRVLRRERQAEVGDLQQKINKVDREVGELRAFLELNNQQLARIDAKLDRMIKRQS